MFQVFDATGVYGAAKARGSSDEWRVISHILIPRCHQMWGLWWIWDIYRVYMQRVLFCWSLSMLRGEGVAVSSILRPFAKDMSLSEVPNHKEISTQYHQQFLSIYGQLRHTKPWKDYFDMLHRHHIYLYYIFTKQTLVQSEIPSEHLLKHPRSTGTTPCFKGTACQAKVLCISLFDFSILMRISCLHPFSMLSKGRYFTFIS